VWNYIPGDTIFWKRLWKLRVPNRAHHFAWRFATDSLPTSENLRKKTLQVSATCPFCQDENGFTAHLFFQCPFARTVFTTAGLWNVILASERSRGELWFRQVLLDTDLETAEFVLMLCDAIWCQRNNEIFENKHLDGSILVATVACSLRSFHRANHWPERIPEVLEETSLLRPPSDAPRIFFDAGIAAGKAGLGVMATDSNGGFVRGVARQIQNVNDPVLAEALAAREAILLSQTIGLPVTPVIVGDALGLVQMIRGEAPCSIEVAAVVDEIRSLLSCHHLAWPYWVPRSENSSAHLLAQYAKSSDSFYVTWDSPPTFLVSNDSGRYPGP
jgi:reverse transcriptase-like protein